MRSREEIKQDIIEFAQSAAIKAFSLYQEQKAAAPDPDTEGPPKLEYMLMSYKLEELAKAPKGNGWLLDDTNFTNNALVILWVRESTTPVLRPVH